MEWAQTNSQTTIYAVWSSLNWYNLVRVPLPELSPIHPLQSSIAVIRWWSDIQRDAPSNPQSSPHALWWRRWRYSSALEPDHNAKSGDFQWTLEIFSENMTTCSIHENGFNVTWNRMYSLEWTSRWSTNLRSENLFNSLSSSPNNSHKILGDGTSAILYPLIIDENDCWKS